MKSTSQDEFLEESLDLAIKNMRNAGYELQNIVSIEIDPELQFMGYAKIDSNKSSIVVADWALDSDMLNGLILHELAHIYFTEINSPSHQSEIINEVMSHVVEQEGLNKLEAKSLNEGFNHLQNIIVDDIVFQLMDNERERKLIQNFFVTWMSDEPTGNNLIDASLLARNAFALASLKRRNFLDESSQLSQLMISKNRQFLSFYKYANKEKYELFESFLIRFELNNEGDFASVLIEYFELLMNLLRPDNKSLETLR
ncbi:MAG: DUF5781 family protein [Nitrososphaerales archaeon]|nr:DUF5781 family protein [Nitrososphaerales archaeon]